MFGENIIMGIKEISMDSKNRITVPKFTGVDSFEELGFVCCSNFKSIYLMRREEVSKYMEDYIKASRITENEYLVTTAKRQLNRELNFMYDFASTDKQCRIKIPTRFINNLQIENKVFVIGENHHLVLCKDEETYLSCGEKEKKSLC